MMFSKTNDRGKLIIHDIKSRDNSKGKVKRNPSPDQMDYGTDQKRQLDHSHASDA